MTMKQFTILLLVALACLFCSLATAQTVEVVDGEYCTDLIAGQNIDIGDVCVTADNEFICVTYKIDVAGWSIKETHLWVGQDIATLPVNRRGNPVIGRFPYGDSGLDTQGWAVKIPIASLCLTVEDICLEDQIVNFAAHAAVCFTANGIVTAEETAWGEGVQITAGGSWAMRDEFTLTCVMPELECETAWAYGDFELNDFINTNRWGWFSELKMTDGDWYRFPIYAGAGQNDIAKGTQVGEIGIQYSTSLRCGVYAVAFVYPEYKMVETHLQVDYTPPTTAAPGRFNQNDKVFISLEETDGEAVVYYMPHGTFDGSNVFTAFHATVCVREIDE